MNQPPAVVVEAFGFGGIQAQNGDQHIPCYQRHAHARQETRPDRVMTGAEIERGVGVQDRLAAGGHPARETLPDADGESGECVRSRTEGVRHHDVGRLRPAAEIECIYVTSGGREVGLGESLLGELLDLATAAGAEEVDATALPGDRETKNMFERAGLVARLIVVNRRLRSEG